MDNAQDLLANGSRALLPMPLLPAASMPEQAGIRTMT